MTTFFSPYGSFTQRQAPVVTRGGTGHLNTHDSLFCTYTAVSSPAHRQRGQSPGYEWWGNWSGKWMLYIHHVAGAASGSRFHSILQNRLETQKIEALFSSSFFVSTVLLNFEDVQARVLCTKTCGTYRQHKHTHTHTHTLCVGCVLTYHKYTVYTHLGHL